LLERGYRVRCLVRDAGRLAGRPWVHQVEVVEADVLDPSSLARALAEVEAAYYLIHSLAGGGGYRDRDVQAGRFFAQAARDARVQQIVYLGGLGDSDTDLSDHLRSRQETGEALREAGIPVTELRAGVIVGSGSLSFEMIRYLTERVPLMVCPRWVYTRTQPIAIRDVLSYLVAAIETPGARGRVLEVGGADVLSYGEMMLGYAKARGLRRFLIPVPVLTPRLSSYWIHIVTPIPSAIARPLVLGLRNEVIVHDATAREIFPDLQPMGYEDAVRRALARLEAGRVETVWTDALASSQRDTPPVVLTTREGMTLERRRRNVQAPPSEVFAAFNSLGGRSGWLYMNWAWKLRGAVDRLFGGVGMRRGRRHPHEVRVGDAVDFWRVEAVEQDHLLRLRAEMKVPGRAWLQFECAPAEEGGSVLIQTAFFAPKGLFGWLYWYALYPIHGLIFSGMIHAIGRRAEAAPRGSRALGSEEPGRPERVPK
jgi:uncharacterized protein YbjT (DUF2867 family)